MGFLTGLLNGYFGWYLTELGASSLLQCAFESIMMVLSGLVIRKEGFHNCMGVCLMSLGISFLG
ncbi:hypothetical protein RvY_02252 [Ramazzottius varieornatus]|uniref:Uncharacterized protein n=1 Tax=Ramazzottius varieornatus TaxID=947166 RepID=A0A1D1UMG3_RAMVA|nr:hypothetical protein RvY_02252 [Ramazzottius varieornatus]